MLGGGNWDANPHERDERERTALTRPRFRVFRILLEQPLVDAPLTSAPIVTHCTSSIMSIKRRSFAGSWIANLNKMQIISQMYGPSDLDTEQPEARMSHALLPRQMLRSAPEFRRARELQPFRVAPLPSYG